MLILLKIGYCQFFETKNSFLFLAYAARDWDCQKAEAQQQTPAEQINADSARGESICKHRSI